MFRTKKVAMHGKQHQMQAGHVLSSVDWFSEMIPAWRRFLLPALDQVSSSGERPRMLLLGCHDARSALWLLEEAFKADGREWPTPDASRTIRVPHLTIVEPFDYKRVDMTRPVPSAERARFRDNLAPHVHAGQASVIKDRAYPSVLHDLSCSSRPVTYDAITIDARGNARQVLEAMVMAWPMLRRGGGLMIVTNYTYSSERDSRCPRRGIDAFLDAYSDDLRVLATQWHVFIARLARPRRIAVCTSEYYLP